MNDTIQLILNKRPVPEEEARRLKDSVLEYKGFKLSPLLLAVKSDNFEAAKTFLEAGASAKVEDKLINDNDRQFVEDGLEPIHYAARNGNLDMVKLLERYGADVNQETAGTRMTPFFYAIESKNIELVKYISTQLNDLNHKMSANYNALNYALSSFSSNKVIEYLVKTGVNVNDRGAGSWTPLLSSVAKGRYDIAELLIVNNANIYAKTEAGWDMDYLAKDKSWLEQIKSKYPKQWHSKPE